MRDHLIYYRRSKQIRCINMINITCNQIIVTWYGQYHIAPLISILGLHDHHRHRHDTMISIIMISIIVSPWSRLANLLLLLLWLPVSNKVKKLHGVVQWHAGHTINKDNSYGSCRLSYSLTCKSWFLLQEHDQSHTSHIYKSSHPFWPYHITRHMLQKQVRHPLIVVASFFTWLL